MNIKILKICVTQVIQFNGIKLYNIILAKYNLMKFKFKMKFYSYFEENKLQIYVCILLLIRII